MIKSEQYIIIPTGVSSFVVEVKDGNISLVGNSQGRTQEETFNLVRKTLVGLVSNEVKILENTARMWKRFQATKEFMSERELEFTQKGWEKFDLDKFTQECKEAREMYERSLFEFTDLMLEYNIPLHAVDLDEPSPLKGISMDEVKNMLSRFDGDKKEG